MKGLLHLPLRITVPLAVLALALLVGLANWWLDLRKADLDVERQALADAGQLAMAAPARLETHLRAGDDAGAREEIVLLGTRRNLHVAALLDEHGTVRYATRLEAEGRPLAELFAKVIPPQAGLAAFNPASAAGRPTLAWSRDRNFLLSAAPVVLGDGLDRLRPARTGTVLVVLGLSHDKALARWAAGQDMLRFTVPLLAFAAGLALLLERGVTRRLARVVAATERLGAGDLEARTGMTGRDEISQLAGAVDRMAAQLAESQRRAQAEERRFALFMEHLPAVATVKDAEGRYLFINRYMAERFAGPSWLGQTPFALVSREFAERFAQTDRRVLAEGALTTVERVPDKDGAPRDLDAVKFPIVQEGQPPLIGAIALDVTERRRAARIREALLRIAQAAGAAPSLDRLFAEIHGVIAELLPARNFYIALYDRAAELLTFPYFVDEHDARPEPRPLGRGLTEHVLRTGKPLLASPEVFDALAAAGEIENIGAPSLDWLGVPLRVEDRTIGVLAVQSYTSAARLTEDDKAILEFVSTHVAAAIERKRRDEAHLLLVTAVEQAAESVVITDTKGTILYVNPAFERVTGYSRAEAVGQNPRLLKSGKHDRQFYENLWGTISQGQVWHGRFTNKRKDGALYEEEATITPVHDAGGRIVNYVAVKRDITAELNLEAQVREAQRMEAVGRLAGGVAHDFNNLLQAMLGAVGMLRLGEGAGASQSEVFADLEEQIKRGAQLTRQLLLFSRREVGRREPLDLNEVVGNAGRLLRRLLRDNIVLELLPGEGPLGLEADRGQLEQVLMNLAVNASDAMPEGGRLTVRTGREGDGWAFVEVADTGEGIAEENLERIFEPFFTTKTAGRGTGLGLAVVHGIVTAHGGTIEVRSRVGEGSTFRVVLPSSAAAEAAPVDQGPAMDGMPSGRGERILVVEDNPEVRGLLAKTLTWLGYRVTAAASAEEAGLLPAEAAFDLLLSDVMLPGATGMSLAETLRERWPELKVILMSGYTEDDVALRQLVSAGERFLHKPVDLATLTREVRAALDEGQPSVG